MIEKLMILLVVFVAAIVAALWLTLPASAMPYTSTYSFQCRPHVPHQTSRICLPPPAP